MKASKKEPEITQTLFINIILFRTYFFLLKYLLPAKSVPPVIKSLELIGSGTTVTSSGRTAMVKTFGN